MRRVVGGRGKDAKDLGQLAVIARIEGIKP
jgi:hypothetical protein